MKGLKKFGNVEISVEPSVLHVVAAKLARGDPRICAASIDILNISYILYLIIIHKFKFFSSHATCFSNQECFSVASAVVLLFAYIILYQ